MLLPDEWQWLRPVILTKDSERRGMSAAERVVLYAMAIRTGLRAGELRSLTRGRLFLDSDPPYVTCKAGATKNAKDARQYVPPELADELRSHIANKAPRAAVFGMPTKRHLYRDRPKPTRSWIRKNSAWLGFPLNSCESSYRTQCLKLRRFATTRLNTLGGKKATS